MRTSSGRERPCCPDREKGSEAVSPVAIVWPCPLAVDAYAATLGEPHLKEGRASNAGTIVQ
jgi:hypothetical protein